MRRRRTPPLLFAWLLWTMGCSSPPPSAPSTPPSPSATTPEQHHQEGRVTLNLMQQKAARLQVESVALRSFSGDFQASGTLTYDKDLQVRVTSPLPGKAIELRAGLGDVVSQGQVLAVIDCPELVRYKADYHEAETDHRLAILSYQRRRSMALYGDETRRPLESARTELAKARAELDVADISVHVNLQSLKRADDLLDHGIVSKAQWEQAQADYQQSQARQRLAKVQVGLAQQHLKREEQVQKLGLLADKEIQEAQANRERAHERAKHLREGLEALQADPDGHGSLTLIRAPISATVTARPITLGESVTPEEELFTLVNAHRLWLWVSVLESELSKLRSGQRVEVSVPAFPGQTFKGVIGYIAPELDEKTRAARAQVVIDNSNLRLKPAMVAQVRVVTGKKKTLVIPAMALQHVEDLDVVYLQVEPEEFERRPVVVKARSGEWLEIGEGLKVGDRIVTQGSSILKSEDLKGSTEEGGHTH